MNNHTLTDNTFNDVCVTTKKIDGEYIIYCDCGAKIKVKENPIDKVLVCDINEEKYWIRENEITLNLAYFLLNNKVYQLKEFIELTIIEEDDGFFAVNEKFDLYGFGESASEAKEDAREDLKRRYEWKFETEFPIPKDMITWLELVDSYLEKENV